MNKLNLLKSILEKSSFILELIKEIYKVLPKNSFQVILNKDYLKLVFIF